MTWRTQAACRTVPTSVFFPEQGENAAAAKATCQRCPVARQCAQEGADEYHGVWGGVTPVERGNARSRGQRLRLTEVLACTQCDARVWVDKRTSIVNFRCEQCRADDQAIAS